MSSDPLKERPPPLTRPIVGKIKYFENLTVHKVQERKKFVGGKVKAPAKRARSDSKHTKNHPLIKVSMG